MRSKIILLLCAGCYFLAGCHKFLDEKAVKKQVVPSTLADLQALLDFHTVINERSPILTTLASDDYYLPDDIYLSCPENDRLNYIWDKEAVYPNSWTPVYGGPIYYSNVVLSQLPLVRSSEAQREQYNVIKGSALFIRAFFFERLAQLYCLPYSTASADKPGIVLRLTADVEAPSNRATVQQTYDQIIKDLKEAITLLPVHTSFSTRPNKAAAYGALARTYLSMRDYANAGLYADSCLQEDDTLMDYNTLIPLRTPPIDLFNSETLFCSEVAPATALLDSRAVIDSTLYQSYDDDDLRKQVFFKPSPNGNYAFQGSYAGTYSTFICFDGITTDEMYLIRAESYARGNDPSAAMKDLNALLRKRWKAGNYTDKNTGDAGEALALILNERRKELVYRGLRWSDLRRLNEEGYNITLKRIIQGVTYTLPPHDLRWVMLIPPETTNYSNIQQNPR